MNRVIIIILTIFIATTLSATLTRVKSLGDVENPVDGKISGLIKDDIVDIYFNPAKVNEVKALLILSAFNLNYGADGDEYREEYSVTEAAQTTVITKKVTQEKYDFNLDTGVLIPLNIFNIFINYSPQWYKYYSEETIRETISGLTNKESTTITHQKELTQSPVTFDITMGFNLKERVMLGIRTGYSHYEHTRYSERDNEKERMAKFTTDRFVIGSGIEFNFTKNISLSITGDFSFSQKDDFPLTLVEIDPSLTNDYNYDKNKGIFDYNYTEKEANYGLRIYPELKLKGERFYRFLLGINYYNYTKQYNFNEQGDLAGKSIKDFSKNNIILSSGVSYNYYFSKTVKAIYGIKYTGMVWGNEKKVKLPDNVDIEISRNDHFIGGFAGFDTRVSPMVYLRVGISQGFYRYIKTIEKTSDKISGNETEVENLTHQILPQTVFTLGLYVQPAKDLIFELNFLAGKDTNSDWSMENISYSESVTKENSEEIFRTKSRNYDFQIGVSVSYKI